jgi:hypothetical protein
MRGKVMYHVLIFLIGLNAVTGCALNMGGDPIVDHKSNDLDGQTGCEQIVIDESKYNSAIIDNFTIQNAFIANDSLMVLVQYGGGCGTTDFNLLTNGLFMESDPVQLDVLLSFIDEDPCEAAIQRMLCFDLSNLIVLYSDSYQTSEGTIIVRFKGYDDYMGFDF